MNVLVLSQMYPNRVQQNNAIFIHMQVKGLVNNGCSVRVLCPIPITPKPFRNLGKWSIYNQIPIDDELNGINVHYPRYLNLPGTWFRKYSYRSMLRGIKKKTEQIISSFKPDIIHAHTATPAGYVALQVSRRYNIPLICSLRGSDINVYPYYSKFAMRCTIDVLASSQQIISVSSSLKKAAEILARPNKVIKVIYNGCDMNEFSRNDEMRHECRRKLNISYNDRMIIFVGNLKKSKGIFELLNVFKKIKTKDAALHLCILGEGPEMSSLLARINILRNKDNIHVVGNRPHNEMAYWLSASDLFVLPTHYEGLPNVVLEAMACSLPVIASNVGGIPEIITHKENGILVKEKDEKSLKEAIETVLNNDVMAEQLGREARRTVEERFSWIKNANEVMHLYEEVLS